MRSQPSSILVRPQRCQTEYQAYKWQNKPVWFNNTESNKKKTSGRGVNTHIVTRVNSVILTHL